MIVDPTGEIVTVQLDEGRRPAACDPPPPPSPTVPCRLWALWSVYIHCIAGRRFTTAGPVPTPKILWAGDLARGLSRLVKANSHKSGVPSSPRVQSRRCQPVDSFRSTGLGCFREPGCAGSETARLQRCQVPYRRYGVSPGRKVSCQETLCSQCWSRMGPQGPCWQGRRSCGPTRFGCGCHTVVLMRTRDASFGAQLDEEESWTGMIAVMLHPLSSKSGAPRPLTAAHRAAQWSQTLSQLTAYHSGTGDPMELANGS